MRRAVRIAGLNSRSLNPRAAADTACMAVPRPVLLAILGLALCVTALVAVRGSARRGRRRPGADPDGPAPTKAEPAAARRPRPRPHAPAAPSRPTPAKPAEEAGKAAAPQGRAASYRRPRSPSCKSDAQLASVAKALGQDDVVVLFFTRPGAADDTGAAQRRREAARHRRACRSSRPSFEDLDDYRPVLAGAGVSQVPVDRHRQAGPQGAARRGLRRPQVAPSAG